MLRYTGLIIQSAILQACILSEHHMRVKRERDEINFYTQLFLKVSN